MPPRALLLGSRALGQGSRRQVSIDELSGSAAREAGGAEPGGGGGAGRPGDLEQASHRGPGELLRLRGRGVLADQLLAELLVALLVGLDVLAVDPHGLGVAAALAQR